MGEVKCWEIFKCNKEECPVYKSKEPGCWLISGTHCRDEIQGKFLEKMEICLNCEVFKANMDVAAMEGTLKVMDKQFKQFKRMVEERDKELEDISMELALGLSEALEALNKIASGDPRVMISEVSGNEMIAKLKQAVSKTAEGIGTIVDQSHEFAIGLAEHFDVLHKVSKGDLNARISESSQDELLKALGRITNQMIESVSREITERRKAEEELREKAEREDLILRSLPMVFYTAQAFGNWIWVSEQIDRISGFSASKFVDDPYFWVSRLLPDDRERVLREHKTIHLTGTTTIEYLWQCADGTYRWFRNQAVLIRDEQGNPKEIIGTWRDITERKQAEEALWEAKEKMEERVIERTKELNEATLQLKARTEELEQHNREISLLGETSGLLQICQTTEEAYSIIIQFVQQLFSAESGALCIFSASRNIVEAVAVWGESQLCERVFAPDDCWALRRGHLHLVKDPQSGLLCRHLSQTPSASYMCVPMTAQGEILGMLYLQSSIQGIDQPEGVRRHFTESKQRLAVTIAEQVALALANLKLRESLRIQSIRDPLTGLFNRRYMEESLEREVRRVSRKNSPLGVIMLDIDDFKNFNDTFGHDAGDAVLREFGSLLKGSIRAEDIVCRYGGEEFVIIMPDATLEANLQRAELLREGVKHLNVRYHDQTLGSITISVGVAIFPDHGPTGEAVLKAADAALYRAKAEGRDRVVVAAIG